MPRIRYDYKGGFNQVEPFLESKYVDQNPIANGLLHSVNNLIAQNIHALNQLVKSDAGELAQYGYSPKQIEAIHLTNIRMGGFKQNSSYPMSSADHPAEKISDLIYLNPSGKAETNKLKIKCLKVNQDVRINVESGNRSTEKDYDNFALPLIHHLVTEFAIPAWGNPGNPTLKGEIVESVQHRLVSKYRVHTLYYLASIALNLEPESQSILDQKIQQLNRKGGSDLDKPFYSVAGRQISTSKKDGPDGTTPDQF